MTNPTRQEIIDAYKALDTLCEKAGEDTSVKALRSLMLSALPPRPNPTMAEIIWDDDKHYLAEALHPTYGKVAMYYISFNKDWIAIMYLNEDEEVNYAMAGLADLEPTGRHYFRSDKD